LKSFPLRVKRKDTLVLLIVKRRVGKVSASGRGKPRPYLGQERSGLSTSTLCD